MEKSAPYVDLPASRQRSSATIVNRSTYFILPILVVVLIGASLFWLQWASQRGVTLGYPTPKVHIISTTPSTLLINTAVQFSANATGRDMSYTWDFGDGTNGVGASVSHTYQRNETFTVVVRGSDAINQTSTDTTSVRVTPPAPKASFTYTVSYGYVYFDASGSATDPSTSIASYNWNFGDGTNDPNGSSQESHAYYNTGTYQVSLVVTDATGQTSDPYTLSVVV